MEFSVAIIALASLGAFFMAFNNGANDVANAFASAVGSRAITVKQALVIAAVLNLVGSVVLGSKVATTLLESVLAADVAIDPKQYVLGMIATLLASGIFILVSTLTGMPVSSTHAIVGSMAGVGILIGGFSALNWKIFGVIGISWLASPIISAFIAWLSIRIIRKWIYKSKKKGRILKRFKNRVPIFIAISVALFTYSVLERSPFRLYLDLNELQNWGLIVSSSAITYFFVRALLRRWAKKVDRTDEGGEAIFKKLQVGTSCYVAFSHGANDVSNSIAPVLGIFIVMKTGAIPNVLDAMSIPIWILLLGGAGMALGIILLGHKVMATLGNKITLMTNSRGFSVDFSTATTVVLASILGMPISTTHAATGSVIGVGLDRIHGGLNIGLLVKILAAWLITVPAAAAITILFYHVLNFFF